jgi:hypothetical protein
VLPSILAELATFRYVPELIGDAERKEIQQANGEIEKRIAAILEENSIEYREIELVTKNLGGALLAIMENVGTRANNACAGALSKLATETFGEPLTLKKLADYARNREITEAKER